MWAIPYNVFQSFLWEAVNINRMLKQQAKNKLRIHPDERQTDLEGMFVRAQEIHFSFTI